MKKNRFDFMVEVFNDEEIVFSGIFEDFIEINSDNDTQTVLYYIDCYFDLITNEKNSVTVKEFHSGIWTVTRI